MNKVHIVGFEWVGYNRKAKAPWVARIVNPSVHPFERVFLERKVEYTLANYSGFRGVWVYFVIEERTLYEAEYRRLSFRFPIRTYLLHDGYRIIHPSLSEARACLSAI